MGGGLDPSATLATTFVNGKLFVDLSSQNRRCMEYLGKPNAMVEYIKRLRNEKVHGLMPDKGDPNDVQGDGSLRLPKRELFDMIPPILTLDVATVSSMVASVNVLAPRHTHAKLQVEVTKPNMALLLKEPAAEPSTWPPTNACENVTVSWHSV